MDPTWCVIPIHGIPFIVGHSQVTLHMWASLEHGTHVLWENAVYTMSTRYPFTNYTPYNQRTSKQTLSLR